LYWFAAAVTTASLAAAAAVATDAVTEGTIAANPQLLKVHNMIDH